MSQYIRPPHDRPRSRRAAPAVPARAETAAPRRGLGHRVLHGLAGCAPAVWPGLALIPLVALLASWWLGVL